MQETILENHLETSRWSPQSSGTVASPGGAFDERLHHASRRQAADGNKKTPLLMSSGLGRVCLPQETKHNAGACNNYSRKVGCLTHKEEGGPHLQERATGGSVEEGRPSHHLVEARSREFSKLSKHRSGAKDYYSKGSHNEKK